MSTTTTTETIIATAVRSLMDGHPSMCWQFLRDDRGFFAREWFDINALNEQERAEYDAEPMPPECAEDLEYTAHLDLSRPRFPTLELAKEYAALCDGNDNIGADMRAFGAPSECYTDAYRGHNRRMCELLAKSDRPDDGELAQFI